MITEHDPKFRLDLALQDCQSPVRRHLIKGSLFGLGLSAFASQAMALNLPMQRDRRLHFYCRKTGETIKATYWAPDIGYVKDSIKEISWALRDTRSNTAHPYDTAVLDQLHYLQQAMGYQNRPIHITSAYRSPQTNAMLRRRGRGVAKNSYHMHGQAIDIIVPGKRITTVRRAALSMRAGGVGYYPRSGFVHIDSGPVRSWS